MVINISILWPASGVGLGLVGKGMAGYNNFFLESEILVVKQNEKKITSGSITWAQWSVYQTDRIQLWDWYIAMFYSFLQLITWKSAAGIVISVTAGLLLLRYKEAEFEKGNHRVPIIDR